MTVLQRVASVAAMVLCTIGSGVATPGLAAGLDRPQLTAASLAIPFVSVPPVNGRDTDVVPAPIAGTTPEVAGVTVERLPGSAQSVTGTDETAEYASLEDAVDAQDVPDTVGEDLTCLAGAIYFESKGEPLSGQLAVADVVINRSRSGRFPDTICGVVKQAGQFSFVRDGAIPDIDTGRSAYRTALAVAQIALAKAWHDPAPDALYFHARRVSPGWGHPQVAAIGHHIFFR